MVEVEGKNMRKDVEDDLLWWKWLMGAMTEYKLSPSNMEKKESMAEMAFWSGMNSTYGGFPLDSD